MSDATPKRRGIVFVISAPSGTGKSTLARRLLESVPGLKFSVSYTTRPRRAGEESGREYHFVDAARFDALAASGGLLEWAQVFGERYGTGRDATEAALAAGDDLLLDIDVQGARQIRASGLDAVSIFVMPPTFAALESRLKMRASDEPH
ncbi:MAG TPA: guanylate kinase, partial [Candidatus Bathyarchaeia archaeon]|nr:guanylate kinase [Candidatus Bathyarchaeia archaeon]